MRDQRDQLRGIIDSNVQFGSFGFDASFQRAVTEIMMRQNDIPFLESMPELDLNQDS